MRCKDTKTSDYVVGQVHGARGGDRYLLAQTRHRVDFPSTLLAVRQMCGTWPAVSLKLVEDLRHQIAGFVEVNPEGARSQARLRPARSWNRTTGICPTRSLRQGWMASSAADRRSR
jgi:phage terminase large subunit-like protein